MKVASFQVEEHQAQGIADVFLSYGVVNDSEFYAFEEGELEFDEQAEFDFEKRKHKLFSVVNSTFSGGRAVRSEVHDSMYYVIQKEAPDVMDYYLMIQKYINEFCEFIDQDHAIYFKVNTY